MIKDCPPSGCKLSSPGYPGLPPQVGFDNNHFDDNRYNPALIITSMIIIIIVVGFINIIAINTITMLLDICKTQPTSKPHYQLTHWPMNNHQNHKTTKKSISCLDINFD